ncbi:MAG: hypothetical protein M3010_09925 [Candidatus Dormibacteraeota bacterium]|nr:hypothetical protein [Candidatus Dormibacteraeota bacterium]
MADVLRQGLEGLLESLSEQQLLRGTGALTVGADARVFVVFGHVLHAVAGDATGMKAVAAIGAYARADPACSIAWIPGVTAGKAHSVAPDDGVLEHLRSFTPGAADSSRAEEERANDRIEDLGLRRLMAEQPPSDIPVPGAVAEAWGTVIAAICGLLEEALHRHARVLVAVVRSAQPEPRSILGAIDRARSLPLRAVSRAQVATLLDAAESMVREQVSRG